MFKHLSLIDSNGYLHKKLETSRHDTIRYETRFISLQVKSVSHAGKVSVCVKQLSPLSVVGLRELRCGLCVSCVPCVLTANTARKYMFLKKFQNFPQIQLLDNFLHEYFHVDCFFCAVL